MKLLYTSLLLAGFLAATPLPLNVNAVRGWLPLRVGDRWVYEVTRLGGDRNHPEVHRWQQEDLTTAIEDTPDGILVRRKVNYLNGSEPFAPDARVTESNILVHQSCIYYLNEPRSVSALHNWDSNRNAISSDFHEALANDETLPDVCFPLRIAKAWGDPKQGRDLWIVAGKGIKHPDDPASVTKESWRLEANLSSGDDNYIWFQKGIGLIAARTFHNGTYDDYQVRLIRFEPGNSKP